LLYILNTGSPMLLSLFFLLKLALTNWGFIVYFPFCIFLKFCVKIPLIFS
jgi:hypothetical protein